MRSLREIKNDDDDENGKLSTPSVASLLVPPVSGGQSVWCEHKSVVTDSSPYRGIEWVRSPPETGASTPQGGEGVDKSHLATKHQSADTCHQWGCLRIVCVYILCVNIYYV